MNCDEAFDALTRPHSQSDSALKWHLEMCPRCREMQDVLAPALAMFSEESERTTAEISEPRSSRRLDAAFWEGDENPPKAAPFLTPEAVRVAEQTANALRPSRRQPGRIPPRLLAVGAVCLLAACGVFFAMRGASAPPDRPETTPVILADQCLWTNRKVDPPNVKRENNSSRWVVLSCVACHLEPSLD